MFDIIVSVIKVYYTDISNCEYTEADVAAFPKIRRDYVNGFTDEKRKRQSVMVWMLLEYALKEFKHWGSFTVDLKGRWRILEGGARFSLAHSENFIAVAVTNTEYVGIDVEKCSDKVLKLKSKLGEYSTGNISNIEYLTREWTRRESAFKAGKKCDFYSRKIFDKSGDEYFLTLCTKDKFEDYTYVDFNKLIKK